MGDEVARRIADRIRRSGPITFAEFMEEALYGPGGFYETPPVGPAGHFVTSPHVHPVFARLVGVALEALWVELGRPSPFRIVEAGAGDGTMARELVGGFARGGIDLEYTAVEISPGAREALENLGISASDRLTDRPPLDPGVVVANELLDNLPFRRVRREGDTVLELRVGLEGDRFVEVETPCDDPLAEAAAAGADGAETIVPTGALAFTRELASTLRRGYALLIDYGSATGGPGEPHGYRGHRVVERILESPGSADITAGLDFGAVSGLARELGMTAFEPVAQWRALMTLGYRDWARAELDLQGGLLTAARGMDAARTWSDRNRASLLVDPAGLGRLHWLVLATAELPEPEWLERAREAPAPLD